MSALAKKLWRDEMDQWPESKPGFGETTPETLAADFSTIRRNIVQSFTRGMGFWFFDFGFRQTSGWWDNPQLLEDIGRLKTVLEGYYKGLSSVRRMSFYIYSNKAFYYTGNTIFTDPLTDTYAVNSAMFDALHSGACIDMIELSDLQLVDWNRYLPILISLHLNRRRSFVTRWLPVEGI